MKKTKYKKIILYQIAVYMDCCYTLFHVYKHGSALFSAEKDTTGRKSQVSLAISQWQAAIRVDLDHVTNSIMG